METFLKIGQKILCNHFKVALEITKLNDDETGKVKMIDCWDDGHPIKTYSSYMDLNKEYSMWRNGYDPNDKFEIWIVKNEELKRHTSDLTICTDDGINFILDMDS